MGEFADRVALLSVQADSPDGRVRGRVGGRMRVDIRFRGGAYDGYAERDLGHQLGQLASVLFSRYRREYDEVTAVYRDGPPAAYEEPEDVAFRQRRAELVVHGRSGSGWIEVSSRALVRWDVVVAAGAVRALTEQAFLAEVDGAAADILRDWQQKVIVLGDQIYGIGVPSALRRPADRR
jgi:hypothetical protein